MTRLGCTSPWRVALAIALVALAASCARIDAVRTRPIDPTGTWELQLTYEENGCFNDWPAEGTVLSSVELVLTRDELGRVLGRVEGVLGAYVALVLGTRDLLGEISSGHLRLRLDGRYSSELVGCAFVYGMDLDGIVDGDAIEGPVTFGRRLPDTSLCDPARCRSRLSFRGRRRPATDAGVIDAGVIDAGASREDAALDDVGADAAR
jgi:hypothetical protein